VVVSTDELSRRGAVAPAARIAAGALPSRRRGDRGQQLPPGGGAV